MGYQWDPKKAAINQKSHGVDFADAVGVFEDDWALTIEEQEVKAKFALLPSAWTFWRACWSSSTPIEATISA